MQPTYATSHILLVEDNLGDSRLIREVLKESDIYFTLNVVIDGEEAKDYIDGTGQFTDRVKPNLVILDLNLPKVPGKEVLQHIRAKSELSSVPVVVFSSSEADKDVQDAYNMGANCYVVKPFEFDDFRRVVLSIQHFWLKVVTLPSL